MMRQRAGEDSDMSMEDKTSLDTMSSSSPLSTNRTIRPPESRSAPSADVWTAQELQTERGSGGGDYTVTTGGYGVTMLGAWRLIAIDVVSLYCFSPILYTIDISALYFFSSRLKSNSLLKFALYGKSFFSVFGCSLKLVYDVFVALFINSGQ